LINNGGSGESGGSGMIVVDNYSSLPDPTTVSGNFYWVTNSQGTSWLPGSIGGTFYNSGTYYSNGVAWSFLNVPYQATQDEVNTGTVKDKFVTPLTFTNSTLWDTKQPIGNYATGGGTAININTGDQDLSGLQPKTDASLETDSTTIVGAINEVNSVAKGANKALSFTDYKDVISKMSVTGLNVGQNLYIEELNVPDLWIKTVENTSIPYTYVSDSQFVSDILAGTQIGYYQLSILETQKVDLTNYYTKNEINTNFRNETQATIGTLIEITELTSILDTTKIAASDNSFLKWFSGLTIYIYLKSKFDPVYQAVGNYVSINQNTSDSYLAQWNGTNSKTLKNGLPISTFLQTAGVAGGQKAIGGTGATDILNLQGTLGNGTLTSPSIQALVGNNGATNALTILNNGNVGIGTTSPTEKLTIIDNNPTAGVPSFSVKNSNSAGAGRFSVNNNGTGSVIVQSTGSAYASIPSLYNIGYIGISGNLTTLNFGTNADLDTGGTSPIIFSTGGYNNIPTMIVTAGNPGKIGIGITTPTAFLHIKAGTSTANTSPLKFTSGTLLTVSEDGAIEYLTNAFYLRNDKLIIGSNTNNGVDKLQVNGSSLSTTAKGGTTTDYVQNDANGIRLIGTATQFDDLSAGALTLQQTGPGVSLNIPECSVDFTSTSNLSDYVVQSIQLSHAWKLNSVIFPHIHFVQTTNAVPNFLLQYRWQIDGGATTTDWTNLKCNITAFSYSSGSLNQIAHTIGGITPPVGANLSDGLEFRVIRDTANTSGIFAGSDPVNATVRIKYFDIHIEKDSIGSNTEYSKN
jgi:hypothetical protein